VVGYGMNGQYEYTDKMDYPCPAIRYKDFTKDAKLQSLREKEKSDWKKLSLADKKALYRASFCRTYAELGAPTGEWKSVVAGVLAGLTLAAWMFLLIKKFVMPPLPYTCEPEYKHKQLEAMIKWRANPIEGISSKWDYDKNDWKEVPASGFSFWK